MSSASPDPHRRRVCVVTATAGRAGGAAVRPLDPDLGGEAPLQSGERLDEGDLVLARPAAGGWAQCGARLAAGGSLRAEVVRLAVSEGADPTYPTGVLDEAREWVRTSGVVDEALPDLRHLPWVTVDNTGSRDLDQALCVETEGDGYRVRYAVADASHFVRPGSRLHAEALERGATYYLPGFAVPMLPPMLSEGVVSLNPRVDRRALVFDLALASDGSVRDVSVARARVRSLRKLSYGRVQRAWDEPAGSGFRGEAFAESLGLLRRVGALRADEARRRHAVSYHRHEVEVELDGERAGFRVLARERLEVERCNEQLSLLVNVEGARLLRSLRGEDVQPVFRVHPAPTRERLARFADQTSALAERHRLDPAVWRWRLGEGQPLAAYLEGLPRRGGRRHLTRAVERQALLTNERSQFDPAPGPHHGVAAPVYGRFTAPMREMVGVFSHKELLEAVGAAPAAPAEVDLELRDRVVEVANRARERQRSLERRAGALVLDRLFSAELQRPSGRRRVMRGTVLGLRPRRLYVVLDEPPVEVKVEVASLERREGVRLEADELDLELSPAGGGAAVVRLGDRIRLRVSHRDVDSGRWHFEMIR